MVACVRSFVDLKFDVSQKGESNRGHQGFVFQPRNLTKLPPILLLISAMLRTFVTFPLHTLMIEKSSLEGFY